MVGYSCVVSFLSRRQELKSYSSSWGPSCYLGTPTVLVVGPLSMLVLIMKELCSILIKPGAWHFKKKDHMPGVLCVCSVSELECVMAMTVFICLCAFLCPVSAVMARVFISAVLLKMRWALEAGFHFLTIELAFSSEPSKRISLWNVEWCLAKGHLLGELVESYCEYAVVRSIWTEWQRRSMRSLMNCTIFVYFRRS